MLYTVNCCVALRRDDRWLLIVRGPNVTNAPGTLSLVGGRVEVTEPAYDVLENTARRETAEEIGVDLSGSALTYAESTFFVGDTGNQVLNVTFAAELPRDAVPAIAAPDEVAGLTWWTLPELAAEPTCPPWTLASVRRAAAALLTG